MIKRIITLLLIVLVVLSANSCNKVKESIIIKTNGVYDWNKIADNLDDCFTPEVFVRLVDYTMINDLRIKPGKYVWDKDSSFEEISKIFDFALNKKTDELTFGKHNTFIIDKNEVFDWQKARDDFRFWLSNRAYIKVIEYMRDNDIEIASGEYRLKQNTDYTDAMALFKFNKIKHPPLVENQKSLIVLNYEEWFEVTQLLYFWLKPEDRINLMVYMYEGNLVIKPGEYIIKQDMSCEETIQIFEFITRDNL